MKLLPTIQVKNFLSPEECQHIHELLITCGKPKLYSLPDKHGADAVVSEQYRWFYHADDSTKEIRDILDPKFEQVFGEKIDIPVDSHMLDSKIPLLIHADIADYECWYNLIIPLYNYDSCTVIFNEWVENSVDSRSFELFKEQYTGDLSLKIDPKFCVERLSHLHPKDVKYLTLKETFEWKQGSLCAFDRRYFHCSDNFTKRGLKNKIGLIMWAKKASI
jgi:hypothetical protein